MSKNDFINNLIMKLNDLECLDSNNYNSPEDQKCDIYDIIDEYLNDFTLIQGRAIE